MECVCKTWLKKGIDLHQYTRRPCITRHEKLDLLRHIGGAGNRDPEEPRHSSPHTDLAGAICSLSLPWRLLCQNAAAPKQPESSASCLYSSCDLASSFKGFLSCKAARPSTHWARKANACVSSCSCQKKMRKYGANMLGFVSKLWPSIILGFKHNLFEFGYAIKHN